MNIQWSPSPEAIRLADEQPWTGPLSGAFRPAPYSVFLRVTVTGTLMWLFATVSVVWWSRVSERHSTTLLILGLIGIGFTAMLGLQALLLEPVRFRRAAPT